MHWGDSLTQEVDDAVVVACKESDQVPEEEHKCGVDDAVGEVGGGHLEVEEGVHLSGQDGQGL